MAISTAYRLKQSHKGQTCHIVGKGHSLRFLRAGPFEDGGPVIALNHAVLVVRRLGLPNKIYSMQKDSLVVPDLQGEHLLVHGAEAGNVLRRYHPRTLWDNQADFGLRKHAFSASSAVAFARLMGCAEVKFHCFDSMHGDLRTCTFEDGRFGCKVYPTARYAEHLAPLVGQLLKCGYGVPEELGW